MSVYTQLEATTSLTGVVGIAAGMIAFNVAAQYVKAEANTPQLYAYGGIAVEVIMTQMAAAMLGYATIYEVYNSARRAYYSYVHHSGLGNWMGLYQLVAYMFGMIFPAVMSLSGYVIGADLMWKVVEDMETNGTLDQLQGYRMLAYGFMIGVSAWVATWGMIETIDELLPWFNTYNVASEATNNGTRDADGTSITFDLSYHEVALVATYMCVVGGIFLPTTVGAYLYFSDVVAAL